MDSNETEYAGGGIGRRLRLTRFHELTAEFRQYRIDDFIRGLEKGRSSGRILAFVRGLRLSAQLIYALREALSQTDLEVDWGHLLDEECRICSPECDVIVHRRGHVIRWNGSVAPVMDFKFIESQKAVAVVSCKSLMRTVDAKHCQALRPYVSKVLLFAECCRPNAVDRLRDRAQKAGYLGFWYLYTLNEETSSPQQIDERQWEGFLSTLLDCCG